MNGDHIIWQSHKDAVAVLGWGNTREIQWPAQALNHADDIKTFYESLGPERTASLRLGYVFELGPLAEMIFFNVAHYASGSSYHALPTGMAHQWVSPTASMGLRNNSTLTDDAATEITRQGILARKNKETDVAKQCFYRCFIAGLASGNAARQYAGMMNFVMVVVDEQHWLRAYSLCLLAMLLAEGLPEALKEVAENQNKSLFLGLSEKIDEADKSRIGNFFSPSGSVSVPELLWQLEDYEIGRVLGIVG